MIIEFSNTFFPVSVHSRSLDIIYASFAISFMLRPIGGLIFGYIGDIKGYVYSINLSFFFVALVSTVTALIPGHATIGYFGLIIIILCRFLHNLFSASQLAGLLTYSSINIEPNQHKHQAFYTCIAYSTSVVGVLIAALVSTICIKYFGESPTNKTLAWRLPFLLTLPFVLIYYALIKRVFNDNKSIPKTSFVSFRFTMRKLFKEEYNKLIPFIILVACSGSLYYIIFIYLINYMETILHFSKSDSFSINTSSIALSIIAYPICGILTDKFKNTLSLVLFFLYSFIVCIIFLFINQHNFTMFWIILMFSVFAYCGSVSVYLLLLTYTFETSIKMSACSLAFNIGGIISGSAPFFAHMIVKKSPEFFLYYILILSIIPVIIFKIYGKQFLLWVTQNNARCKNSIKPIS